MPQIAFDFTINIPILAALVVGFFTWGKFFATISMTIDQLKKDMADTKDKVDNHDRDLAALTALSDGYKREQFRREARRRD